MELAQTHSQTPTPAVREQTSAGLGPAAVHPTPSGLGSLFGVVYFMFSCSEFRTYMPDMRSDDVRFIARLGVKTFRVGVLLHASHTRTPTNERV